MSGEAAIQRVPPLDDVIAESVLNAIETAVMVVDEQTRIIYVNNAAEQMLGGSAASLMGHSLSSLLPEDSPVFGLVSLVREEGMTVSEYGLTLESPRVAKHFVNVQASPVVDKPNQVVLVFFERSIADKIDRHLIHRNAARSVTAMAAMLAHEVKNPLSGIRGAAQLLEQSSEPDDQTLTRLICDETDRICALVDRMEVFSDSRPLDRAPVNIHQVLERVKTLAAAGFAKGIRITENYDPSLPPVDGNFDQLIQIFLNLIKNAAEACPAEGGEIMISTAYQHGARLAVPGGGGRLHVPLVVSIQDNGRGIPDDMRDHLFDAFITSKPKGSGLGLALVAKIVDDHGGVIEFDSVPGRTVFRVMLPIATADAEREGAGAEEDSREDT